MFFKKNQTQIVDVNKLVEQTKVGVLERDRLSRIEKLLTEKVKEIQASFREELEAKKEKRETCYTWAYPFVLFHNDDLATIANIIEYDLPGEMQRQMEEDYKKADIWNKELSRNEDDRSNN